ncbi:hypothetical protein ACH5RR_013732 [Cinchona calisaya]|uniref:Uncharacterized protein n=1 Tax=Cinchona calisaya TaxID=153742 RepID=A0ABD3A4A2_9GENT
MQDSNEVSILSSSIVRQEEIPQRLEPSGSEMPSDSSILLEIQLHRSNRKRVSRGLFEIEGKAFMIAMLDENEPKTLEMDVFASGIPIDDNTVNMVFFLICDY